jgi:hypothetical protein
MTRETTIAIAALLAEVTTRRYVDEALRDDATALLGSLPYVYCPGCREEHPASEFARGANNCRRWVEEIVPGVEVDLDTLAPNQAVAWGDGKTNHRRYTLIGWVGA